MEDVREKPGGIVRGFTGFTERKKPFEAQEGLGRVWVVDHAKGGGFDFGPSNQGDSYELPG
jgi:hypothetical protein